MNGSLAKPCHKKEIGDLLFEIRQCIIKVPNLTSNAKALFLMTLDLYYSNFTNVGRNLEKLYAQFLIDNTTLKKTSNENTVPTNELLNTSSGNEVSSLNILKNELMGINVRGNIPGNRQTQTRVNKEYIGRPLKASDRLKFVRSQIEPEVRNEDEELVQQKLFEKQVEDKIAKENSIKELESDAVPDAISEVTGYSCSSPSDAISEELPEENTQELGTPPNKSTKERRADKAHFLVRPLSARQRLKIAQQPPEHSDWYAEVERHSKSIPDIAQTSSPPPPLPAVVPLTTDSSTNSYTASSNNKRGNNNSGGNKHIENSKNHLNTSNRSNYSNPVSPNEIQRNGNRNHSFRSNKSDRSTQSVDRNIESKFEFKIFENRRNNYRNDGTGGGNYNNYGSNTWGRGNRQQYRGNNNDRTDNQRNPSYGGQYSRYNDSFNKNKLENGNGGGGGGGYNNNIPQKPSNRYQRQQSIESESGVQKRFNIHNNRQYNNSSGRYSNNSNNENSLTNNRGGGGGGGRYHSKNIHQPLNRSTSAASKQSDDESWDNYGDQSNNTTNNPNSKYSQAFLKFIDDN